VRLCLKKPKPKPKPKNKTKTKRSLRSRIHRRNYLGGQMEASNVQRSFWMLT
jgi:hypothetical protein